MKRIALLLAGLVLMVVLAVPHATTQAAADALCAVTPPSGPIGTVFTVSCAGYDSNTGVYAYLVEPEGTAVGNDVWGGGPGKTDGAGSVHYVVPTRLGTLVTIAFGTWHIAVEQLGLGKSVVHRGEASFRVTGGNERVDNKARVTVSPYIVHKFIDPQTVTASGFAPNEYVSMWIQFAKGACATVTYHTPMGNLVDLGGISTLDVGTYKTDASGAVTVVLEPFAGDNCEGQYMVVARSVHGDHGASAPFILTGNKVGPVNAWLSASPAVQSAEPGSMMSFSGSGFMANEHVSCWATESHGHVEVIPGTRADSAGRIAFSMTLGTIYGPTFLGLYMSGSEGPLGAWSMTCRGDASGATAIAGYRLTGGVVDP